MVYSKEDLNHEAAMVAKNYRKEKGIPARVLSWSIHLHDQSYLAVTLETNNGIDQVNVAI